MYSVLLADDDQAFVDVLDKKISEDASFKIVGKFYDGQNAVEQIVLLRPDIIVLDIIMPSFDGIYIVDYVRRKIDDYDPIIYILSGIGTYRIIKILNTLNIDFFSMKPVSLDVILQNLRAISQRGEGGRNDVFRIDSVGLLDDSEAKDQKIKALIDELGLPPHHKSTQCMQEALSYCMGNPDGTKLITKVLYPEVARRKGLTSTSVERSIRYAIGHVKKAKTPLFNRIFAYSSDKRVTNGEFLAVVSDYLTRRDMDTAL